MIYVLFICHGNICRSPMAQSVFSLLVDRAGFSKYFTIDSAATHTDEIGNIPHRGTREVLARKGVPLLAHRARLITGADVERADYLICMDEENMRSIRRIAGENGAQKARLLLSFAGVSRAIADPWYTGDFEQTFRDVELGCRALLSHILSTEGIRR